MVPPLDRIAGQIREEPSWIGGTDPSRAEYVGPPAEQVRPLLEDLCEFMNRDDISPVAQAAIAHAQFETIHPFGDGNGRVGRCLIQVLLLRRGLAPRTPPISLVLGANKDAYISGLESFAPARSTTGSRYFAGATESGGAPLARVLRRGGGDARGLADAVAPVRADSAALALIDLLPRYPIVTAAAAEGEIGRSRRATITGLERLADAEVLTRHRNQKKGDSWEAKELFALLDEFERSRPASDQAERSRVRLAREMEFLSNLFGNLTSGIIRLGSRSGSWRRSTSSSSSRFCTRPNTPSTAPTRPSKRPSKAPQIDVKGIEKQSTRRSKT